MTPLVRWVIACAVLLVFYVLAAVAIGPWALGGFLGFCAIASAIVMHALMREPRP